MLIIGHRGAAGVARENTIGSFKKAESLGVDMVEIDLRRRKDGQIVALHGRLSRAGKQAPTLSEILTTIKLPLNLELKQAGLEKEVLSEIRNFSSEVLISSKYPSVLKKIRALDEKVKLGLVLGKANFFLLASLKNLDQVLHLYSIHLKTFLTNRRTIVLVKSMKKKVFVWTVNELLQYKKFRDLGVDGVFTDRPDLIKK